MTRIRLDTGIGGDVDGTAGLAPALGAADRPGAGLRAHPPHAVRPVRASVDRWDT
ncbi:MAG: hypothetical protein JXC32_20350 [Anaerolineae bacterium]|nr:hypothetical protein [Anaerolineae bacterium]